MRPTGASPGPRIDSGPQMYARPNKGFQGTGRALRRTNVATLRGEISAGHRRPLRVGDAMEGPKKPAPYVDNRSCLSGDTTCGPISRVICPWTPGCDKPRRDSTLPRITYDVAFPRMRADVSLAPTNHAYRVFAALWPNRGFRKPAGRRFGFAVAH